MKIEININELREKKIFVATPMYGGQCSGMYTKASCDLATTATKYGMDVKFFYLFNESLITRARNYLADEFLRSPYTHLMFIDSDINYNPQDILALATLCDDDHPIIGAPYPKKCIAWEKVRNAVDAGLGDETPLELEKYTGDFVFNPTEGTTQIRVDEPVEVMEIGTGFMLIQRRVFEKFRDEYPQFSYKPDHNRSEHFDGARYIHAFFDTVIDNELYAGKGANGSDRYLSEDYMFCQWARKIGFTTWLCPWMELGHVGTHVFNGTLKDLGKLEFASHGADYDNRPMKEARQAELKSRKERRAEERKAKKAQKKLTKPQG